MPAKQEARRDLLAGGDALDHLRVEGGAKEQDGVGAPLPMMIASECP